MSSNCHNKTSFAHDNPAWSLTITCLGNRAATGNRPGILDILGLEGAGSLPISEPELKSTLAKLNGFGKIPHSGDSS